MFFTKKAPSVRLISAILASTILLTAPATTAFAQDAGSSFTQSVLNGITYSIGGSGKSSIRSTDDGVELILGSNVIVAKKGSFWDENRTVVINGESIQVKQFQELKVSEANGKVTVSADQKVISEVAVASKENSEFKRLQADAAKGDLRAINDLGVAYLIGEGVEKDIGTAVELYRKAGNLGYKISQVNLAELYWAGRGDELKRDRAEALRWAQLAVKQHRHAGGAQLLIGHAYYFGIEYEKDYDKALKWYKRAASSDTKLAMHNLGIMYRNGQGVEKNQDIAIGYLTNAAELGDAPSQDLLAEIFWDAKGVKRDREKGLAWARRAAESNQATSQLIIGIAHDLGLGGVETDKAVAAQWYEKAAKNNNAVAMNNLGVFYEDGTGVEKNIARAIILYERAFERKYKRAASNLALVYWGAEETDENTALALKWAREASEFSSSSQFILGYANREGLGIPKDNDKALKWFMKAAEQEHSGALNSLGYMYMNGIGVPVDANQAIGYLVRAEERGNKNALYNLGIIYSDAKYQAVNLQLARQYFQKAVENGVKGAREKLAELPG